MGAEAMPARAIEFLLMVGIASLLLPLAHGQAAAGAGRLDQGRAMETVKSKDGTTIAYEKSGKGPALILVGGALAGRTGGSELAQLLAPHFTVYSYDRRGRGDSGDTKPYAVEREVEDLEALIDAAGGAAFVYGKSSGAALA